MADVPVDPGPSAGLVASSEPNPLGLSLGFVSGSALVTLQDRALAPGLTIRALELELAEVEFPLDLSGGAEEFQRRSTRLRSLALEAHVEPIGRVLDEALSSLSSPVRSLSLATERDRLVIEGQIGVGDARAPFAADLLLAPGEPRVLRVFVDRPLVFGFAPIPSSVLADALREATARALSRLGARVSESVEVRGASSFSLDPVDALLWAIMPRSGWKVPSHEDAPFLGLELTPTGALRIVVGDPTSDGAMPFTSSPEKRQTEEERFLRAHAREDAGQIAARADHLLAEGRAAAAFDEMRAALDASGGPDVLFERLLSLGSSVPDLFADTADLATDRLAKDPKSIPARLAKAVIAAHEGRGEEAVELWDSVGRQLRSEGRRRMAGLAFRAAARSAESDTDRVRLLEETIALRPDDTWALEGLLERLPALGRATAAVRAARRLANLAPDPQTRARAHVAAGELLRTAVGDPAQAKRELERALRLVPDDPRALEGLALAILDHGEPRRAAGIFDKLIARAEADGDRARAARLCIALGDLWSPQDAEAAMLRYRRAHHLGGGLVALARLVGAAERAGRTEAAMEAVELALPLPQLQAASHLDDADREAARALRMGAGRLYAARSDQPEEAIVQYRAALELDPGNIEALAALGGLYERQGDSEALASVLGQRAAASAEAGAYEEAAQLWGREAEIVARDPERLEGVQRALLNALDVHRGDVTLLDALVSVAAKDADPAKLVEALDRRLLLDDSPEVRAGLLTRLGAAFEALKKTSEAARAYEEAVVTHDAEPAPVEALIRIYRARDDRDRLSTALAHAARLARTPGARGELLAERGRLLADAGHDAEAYDAVAQAVAAGVRSSESLQLATSLALRTRRFEEARSFAEQRLEVLADSQPETRLGVWVDLARVAEGLQDQEALIAALSKARELADPASETGRQLAARLARELYAAERIDELAELQRRRGRVDHAPASERAERFIEAARLSTRMGDDVQAEADVAEALAVLGTSPADRRLELTALEVLESMARRRGDGRQLGDVLGRRAVISEADEKERLRLEQAEVLREAGAVDAAADALALAAAELPASLAVSSRLGHLAAEAGRAEVARGAFARAAQIAEDRGQVDAAVELHGRAAEVASSRQDAIVHHRAVFGAPTSATPTPWLDSAIQELEQHARAHDDHALLVEILSRRAAVSPPAEAARLLLERSGLDAEALGDDRDALDALRRARALAPAGSAVAEQVDEALASTLERLGLYAEQAAVLVERAERSSDRGLESELYLRAARVYADRLGDRGLALSRAQAAVRADPQHEAARALRISLLREGGRREALAEALSEEAAMSRDASAAATLWIEAAEILIPAAELARDPSAPSRRELEQCLALARRAATASPRAPGPLRAATRYTRALGRADEELVTLSQLVEREVSSPERVAAHIRRAELMRDVLEDPVSAQAELNRALFLLAELGEAEVDEVQSHLPLETKRLLEAEASAAARFAGLIEPSGGPVSLDTRGSLVPAVLAAGLDLTKRNADWPSHVRLLMWMVDLSEDPQQRAELRAEAGEVMEWKLGDGAGAEREYRAALALYPNHARSRAALRAYYVGTDRFGDLADSLGLEALVEVWAELGSDAPPARAMVAAEALWPRMAEGSDERAEVQLRLSDLYAGAGRDLADPIDLLERVAADAPKSHQDAALERMAVLFLEHERMDLYCDVLRRQADRIVGDSRRALAIAELGEALEWKLGDGQGAEREYRTALAVDPGCTAARERLAELLSSQDRFEDIAADLGPEVLRAVLTGLVEQGSRDRERAFRAAEAQSAILPEAERASLWWWLARSVGGDTDDAMQQERIALQKAASFPGDGQAQALDRLRVMLAELGEHGELANVLRRRIELAEDRDERFELHFALGRLVATTILPTVEGAGREAIEEEAERELRQAVELDPKHQEARTILEALYTAQGRFLELGRVLGHDLLSRVRRIADDAGDTARAYAALDALAELSEGERRAGLLVELVGYHATDSAAPGTPRTAEDLYRAALVSDPESVAAREGLRALLEADGRFREIAEVLGPDALRETLEQLRRLDDSRALLPAALALAYVLGEQNGGKRERATLFVEIASLHLADDDAEAAEVALRQALELVPSHPVAREEIRQLLVAQRRLHELADVDEAMVSATATLAAEAGDRDLHIAALEVLAGRRHGEARADTLVLVASLETERANVDAAEARLREALVASPQHGLARADLEEILWSSGRHRDALEALGPAAFVDRAARALSSDREHVRRALEEVRDLLPDAERADALEISASLKDPEADGEVQRRREELEEARGIWDRLENTEGQERSRLALVDLHRERDDVDVLLDALTDALAHARSADVRGSLALERATLLALSDRRDEARSQIEPLVSDLQVPHDQRTTAARMLVDDLLLSDLQPRSPEDLALTAQALELLTEHPALVAERAEEEVAPAPVSPADRERWLKQLAVARELLGHDASSIAEPLEAALLVTKERIDELELRRRLQELYEQLGDWRRAERHASVIAEADDRAELWVGLSELRAWLDDRIGAKAALERALERDPASRAAHESIVRLAEHGGDAHTVLARLEAWAEADSEGAPAERAERLLRAARLAAESDDAERAALLAERAITLLPPGHERAVELAREACQILEPHGATEARVAILTRVVADVSGSEGPVLRCDLADLLLELGRANEASAVIEQGIHRDTPEDDPLVQRLLSDAAEVSPELAARRLLGVADRLGAGPAARRLRVAGAERAELAGDRETARTAWSTVVGEVGGGRVASHARRALARIARELDDPQALLSALLELVEDAASAEERADLYVEAAEVADERLDDAARAEALLERALVERPEDEQLRARYVALLERRGHYVELDRALEQAAEALEGEAKASLLERRAGMHRQELRDGPGTADLLAQSYEAAPTPVRAEAAVRAALLAGEAERAAEMARACLEDESIDPVTAARLSSLRAEALETLGDVDAAVEVLEALARGPGRTEQAAERHLELLVRHGRWRAAARALEESADRVEPGRGLRMRLAAARVSLERVQDPEAAEASLVAALRMVEGWLLTPGSMMSDQIAPVSPAQVVPSEQRTLDSPLLDLAEMARRLGNHGLRVDALRLYAQSLPTGPDQWRALLLLASAERESGDLDAAEFTLREVVATIRDSSEVSIADRIEAERTLGALCLDRGEADDAAEALSRAAEMLREVGPDGDHARADVLVQLGRAHRAASRFREAVRAFEEAHARWPESVSAEQLESAIEAAGASRAWAELLERRAQSLSGPAERAANLREAARIFDEIGEPDRALGPLIGAHVAEPSDRAESDRLEDRLLASSRWSDLSAFLARRLDVADLTEDDRVTLLSARARIIAVRLSDPQGALALVLEAREMQPRSMEVLESIVEYAAALGRDDIRQDALARLATVATTPGAKLRAQSERAAVLEEMSDLAGAARCWEEAIDVAAAAGTPVRRLVARLAAVYRERGDRASEARLWVRAASLASGAEAAAALSRAGNVRMEALEDRRGASVAIEAAVRASPDDLGLRRAAIDLTTSLGDLRKARGHVAAASDAARRRGETRAEVAFTAEEARLAAALGDATTEIALWRHVMELEPADPVLLDELVARGRASLSAEAVAEMLGARAAELSAGLERGRVRLARARLLEEPLGRHWEAEGDRALVAQEDGLGGDGNELGIEGDPAFDEDYRARRSMLDRSGRWDELAELEEQRASHHGNPLVRSDALVEVGRLHLESRTPDRLERARDAFERAVKAHPYNVTALSRLARIEMEADDAARAAPVFDALEALGGAAWPIPEQELLGAAVARENHEPKKAIRRLTEACARDPGSVSAWRALTELATSMSEEVTVDRWLSEHEALLDRAIDASEIAMIHVRRARRARGRGELAGALEQLEQALELDPDDAEARALRRELLEEAGHTALLVDALVDEAERSAPQEATRLLGAALDTAVAKGEHARARRVAEVLVRMTPPVHEGGDPQVWTRLLQVYGTEADGEALVEVADGLGGLEHVSGLPPEAEANLAKVLLHANRIDDAVAVLERALPAHFHYDEAPSSAAWSYFAAQLERALDVATGGEEPRHSAAMLGALRGLVSNIRPGASSVRFLEGVAALLGGEGFVVERLAEAYRSAGVSLDAAARIHRRLLRSDPVDRARLSALLEVLPEEDRMGPRAVLAWIEEGATPRIPPRLDRGLDQALRARLSDPAVRGPLGELLRISAMALTEILPPAESAEQRSPADDDPRVADLVAEVRRAIGIELFAVVDACGGRRVDLEPGVPPVLVIGETLAADGSPAEVRFHLARAAMRVALGDLLVVQAPAAERKPFVELVISAVHPDWPVPPELADGVDLVRARLGADGITKAAARVAELPLGRELDLATWMRGVQTSANRFGAWVSGDLGASIRALCSLEPRAIGESLSTPQERIASVRRWAPLVDLVAFVSSEDGLELFRSSPEDASDDLRFP